VHSFEELFYPRSPILILDDHAVELAPGACGVVPVGVSMPGADREQVMPSGSTCARRSRAGKGNPQNVLSRQGAASASQPLDIRDPRSRHLFVMSEDDIDVKKLQVGSRVNAPTVSTSMATALLAYSGIAVKMLVDQRLDAVLATCSWSITSWEASPIPTPSGGGLLHVRGEVEVSADGVTHTLRPETLFWTSAPFTRSSAAPRRRCAGWRRSRRSRPRATPTGSTATGTT
jgi:hypothetical protein